MLCLHSCLRHLLILLPITYRPGQPQSIGGHPVRDDRAPLAGTTDHTGMDDRTKHATSERIGNDSRTNPSTGHDNYGSSANTIGSGGRGPTTSQFGFSDRTNPTTTAGRDDSGHGTLGDRIGTDGPISG